MKIFLAKNEKYDRLYIERKKKVKEKNMKTKNETKKLNLTEEIASKIPSGLTENEVLKQGFKIGVELMSPLYGEKYAKNFIQKSYWYDEDFCFDILCAYRGFGKELVGTTPSRVYPENPHFNPFENQ